MKTIGSLLGLIEDLAVLGCAVAFFGGLATSMANPWWQWFFVLLGVAIIASGMVLKWPGLVMRSALERAKKMGTK